MSNRILARVLFCVVMCSTASGAGAQISVTTIDGINISLTSQITPVPLNQMHSWVISLHNTHNEPLEDAVIMVDGGMPEHDHGLATSPQVTDYLGDGRYLIEGLRFHMPGLWLLEIQIEHQGRRFRSEATLQAGS